MRRLLLLVCAVVLVDTMLYAALTPLLPHFAREFHLAKGSAGLLVAAYAAGALVGGIPGGFAAARLGPRRAVLAGLVGMAAAGLGFAFAGSFEALLISRSVQGAASALTWAGGFSWLVAAAPRERRGQLLGSALGVAVFGALLGPVVGAAAALAGRATVFTAVSALGAVLAVWAAKTKDAPAEPTSLASVVRAGRNPRFAAGVGLMMLPSLLFGTLGVLAPLRLAAAGWGAAAIGAVWLVGAGLESAQAPLVGRLSDRRGRLLPVRVALGAAAACSLLLAFSSRPAVYVPLVLGATMAYGSLFTPGLALIADGAEAVGLAQGLAFGMMNAGWAVGAAVGPAAGGWLAELTSDTVPFVLDAALCACALALVQGRAGAAAAAAPAPAPTSSSRP